MNLNPKNKNKIAVLQIASAEVYYFSLDFNICKLAYYCQRLMPWTDALIMHVSIND